MITRPALQDLGRFIESPTKQNASALVGIPALIEVLNINGAPYSKELIGLCKWLHNIATKVLGALFRGLSKDALDNVINGPVEEEDWKKVRLDFAILTQTLIIQFLPRLAAAIVCLKSAIARSTQGLYMI